MATTGLEVFDRTLHTTNLWLDEINAEIGPDRHLAWHVLGAVLRSIRDEMQVEQSAHFAAQLPLLIRGAYFDQYRPAVQPASARSHDDFIARIQHDMDGSRPVNVQQAAATVMRTLNRHVTEGQVRKVRDALPKGVRAMWPEPEHKEPEHAGRGHFEPGQPAKRAEPARSGGGQAPGGQHPSPQRAAPAPAQQRSAEGGQAAGRHGPERASDTEPSSIAQSAPGLPNDSSRPVEVDAATTAAVERAMGVRKTRPKRTGE
jgi:uncharacterized protein (DUF2267 family)